MGLVMLRRRRPCGRITRSRPSSTGTSRFGCEGVLTKIEWTNPHSYFYIDVTDDKGNVVNWGCEGGGPGALSRRGFKKRRHQAGRQDCGGRISRQGRLASGGRAARDAAGWAKN